MTARIHVGFLANKAKFMQSINPGEILQTEKMNALCGLGH